MAVQVDIPFSDTIRCLKPLPEAFKYLSDYQKSITDNFPGVNQLRACPDGSWDWEFEKIAHSGYEFQVKLCTKFIATPDKKIEMVPVKKSGYAELSGTWDFTGSEVGFQAKLSLELPVPFFLKSMATTLTQQEITKLFKRYVTNVGSVLSK